MSHSRRNMCGIVILLTSALNAAELGHDPVIMPAPENHTGLPNFFRLSARIRSGGQPQGEAGFAELERIGIRTIVSVDGARPDVELARKHGIRYVHIPISYDGVPDEARAALTRVVRETTGPIYVHCHRGKHRGPAAAAVACVAEGRSSGDAALVILESAGTGKEYGGLWRDVKSFQPLAEDAPLPELREVADVDPLVLAMSSMEFALDRLDAIEKVGWATANPDELRERHEASTLIWEGLVESGRLATKNYPPEMIKRLKKSEMVAEALRKGVADRSWVLAEEAWKSLKADCKSCHQTYRDGE